MGTCYLSVISQLHNESISNVNPIMFSFLNLFQIEFGVSQMSSEPM